MSLDERFESWMRRPVVGLPLRMIVDERWHRVYAIAELAGFIASTIGQAKGIGWLVYGGRALWYPAATILIIWFVLALGFLLFGSRNGG